MNQELIERTGLTNASAYQAAIFEDFANQMKALVEGKPARSLMIESVAGSGKTTTVVALARLVPAGKKVMFLAFTRSIADTLKKRLEGTPVIAMTFNGLGYRAWTNYMRGATRANVELKSFKSSAIFTDLYGRDRAVKEYRADVLFLVGMMKSLGIVPQANVDCIAANGLTDSNEDLAAILGQFNRRVKPQNLLTVCGMARKILSESLRQERVIDFDDQKYMTVVKRVGQNRIPVEKYDVIIVDEVQDVNAVDIAMIELHLKKGGMVVGVGDRRQSLYAFRGADSAAVTKFIKTFDAHLLPLSVTYRCGSRIVAHAQEIVPHIEARPNAHEGKIEHLDRYRASDFQIDDLIVCRNNAPIVSMAFKLIRNRMPVHVRGRDIGKNLIGLIERVAGREEWTTDRTTGKRKKVVSLDGVSMVDLMKRMGEWSQQQITLIREENEDNEAAIERVMDQYESVRIFAEAQTEGTAVAVIKAIEDLFGTNDQGDEEERCRGKIVLSTIHRAKGTEADRVFILDVHLIHPSWVQEGSWQSDQEHNALYVAITRARHHLVYIQSNGFAD